MTSTSTRRFGGAGGLVGRFGVVIVWAVVVVIFAVARPDTFPTASNFATLFASQAPLGILAIALTVPLTAGDYDLSAASTMNFASMVIAVLQIQHHVPIGTACVLGIAAGIVIGVINGALCVPFGIDPFIVTLGMGTVLDGLTLWISNSSPISGLSTGLVNLVVVDRFLGLSLEFWFLLIVAFGVFYVFTFTPIGRRLLIVGRGREVARLSGLKVNRIRILSFVTCGGLSGLAGVVYVGTSGTADPSAGTSYLLPAFAAAFLGATALQPGRFNAWGTLVAVYFLTTGINGLSQLNVGTFVQQLFYGGALIIAVLLSRLAGRPRLRPKRRPPSADEPPTSEVVTDTSAPARTS
ncbi:MAG TPA: ABC transporter permease [Pseudonocardiaceae bacterium]|nr:ABC transporter permease [Pseudonocardiaceae bacterium]